VKTIHLNLASRPYRDYRAVYAVAAALGVLTAILFAYNVQTAYHYFVNTQQTRAEIDALNIATRAEKSETDKINRILGEINTKSLGAEAQFINARIAERVFSWSQLLDRLERVFPSDVRVVSLNPHIDEKGNTHLEMTCVAKTQTGMVNLLNRLIADPHFARAYPRAEQEQQGEYGFAVGVDYLPSLPGATE
jgi:hypothetical protein